MKIFGLGLSRTGTKSLTMALYLLGYKVDHFPRDEITINEMKDYLETGNFNLTIAEEYDSIIDMVPSVMFDGIYHKYPNAKYILTVRNIDDWFKSMEGLYERHLNRCFRNFDGKEHSYMGKYITLAHRHIYGTERLEEDIYKEQFKKYNEDKINLFKDKDNLLVMDICSGNGWKKLCPFLNKEIPDEEFPKIVNLKDEKNNYKEYKNVMV